MKCLVSLSANERRGNLAKPLATTDTSLALGSKLGATSSYLSLRACFSHSATAGGALQYRCVWLSVEGFHPDRSLCSKPHCANIKLSDSNHFVMRFWGRQLGYKTLQHRHTSDSSFSPVHTGMCTHQWVKLPTNSTYTAQLQITSWGSLWNAR